MSYGADANAFNASNRARADPDLDATVMARYEPNGSSTMNSATREHVRPTSTAVLVVHKFNS